MSGGTGSVACRKALGARTFVTVTVTISSLGYVAVKDNRSLSVTPGATIIVAAQERAGITDGCETVHTLVPPELSAIPLTNGS